MSHIDAKAETKGVMREAARLIHRHYRKHFMGDEVVQPGRSVHEDIIAEEILQPLLENISQPQRHARINCNGKSCGEFNCDTCHPQEEALPYEWNEANQVKAREIMARRDRAGFAYDREDFLYTLSFTQMRERQLRETLVKLQNKERDIAALKMSDKSNREECQHWAAKYAAAEAELAALKATPKAGLKFEEWLMSVYPAIAISSDIRPLLMRTAWNAALSSPSLPLEEPEQMVSRKWINKLAAEEAGNYTGSIVLLARELQAWRALAARRSGK